MILNADIAQQIAKSLLQIKAVILQPNKPFTWASGWKSPIYCDNRITLSHPEVRTYIRQEMTQAVVDKYGKPDVIAGVATGAIAQGVLVAQELGIPFTYVRASAKGHGRQNLIEGKVESGQSVVVIEDLISSGKSSLAAVDALREAGVDVKGMGAIFTYGFESATQNFKNADCELFTLGDYDSLIEQALATRYISENNVSLLKDWRKDPANWKK
ncbi:MAG: orotate phosphoribosyltransferase [Flavobacteriales bacterium]|nr:orotate phosphoribosyltransferase [Flavobacteriales bacterium]|tara:strand:- start:1353 stop:1994 length:642 start_codon:yes stop_codon:yes gene_type:complete